MSLHGGFGAALQVRQHTLQEILTVSHRGGQLPDHVQLSQAIPDIYGTGSAIVELDWWVDAPVVELDPANGGFALVRMRCVGDLLIWAASIEPDRLQVRLEFVIRTTLTGEIVQREPGAFGIVATFQPVSVLESHIRILSGGFMPLAWRAYFSSQEFRGALGFALVVQLTNVALDIPSDLGQLFGALRVGDGTTASLLAIVGHELVTFGVDFTNPAFAIATHGAAGDVTPFFSASDLALIVGEALAPLIADRMRSELGQELSADLNSLAISFEGGHLHVTGNAEVSAGSADFRFDATPIVGRPEWVELVDDEYSQYTLIHPASDEIWLDISGVELEASLSWWVGLTLAGGVVLLGPGVTPHGAATVFAQIVNGILLGVQQKLVTSAEAKNLLSRSQEIVLAGVEELPFRFSISSLQVFGDRIQTRAMLKPDESRSGGIVGPTWIDADEFAPAYDYELRPMLLRYHPEDPELRIRWQIRRMDSNEVVRTQERPLGHPAAHQLRANFLAYGAGNQGIERFLISARVYRQVTSVETFDYWNTSLEVRIEDRLDRSFPFTHWRHEVVTPKVVVHPDGSHEKVGKNVFIRHSVIHRTDIPGRCRFASRISLDVPRPDYLLELPFELDELDAHRSEVCDFCFYGGPDKSEALLGRSKVAPIGSGSQPLS